MLMNKKDWQRKIAYEVLVILGMLALLTYICRLWPILLLIILGIFIAAIRLLFLSSKKVAVIEPLPLLPEPAKAHTEKDVRDMAYTVILKRITELVTAEYPYARWVWEHPGSKQLIEQGEDVFILLNRAGGYRRAKVSISNLQVTGLEYQTIPMQGRQDTDLSDDTTDDPDSSESSTPPDENYELLAFEWVEANLMELNTRCNEAIGSGLDELVIPAEELPVRESWAEICRELKRNGLEDIWSISDGIKINLKQ